MRSLIGGLLCALTALPLWPTPGTVKAAADANADKPPTVKLVLQPAVAPRRALQYQLLPPVIDRKPGNAAVLYNRVPAEQADFFSKFYSEGGPWAKIEKWLEVPLGDPREKELRRPEWTSLLGGVIFEDLDRAARCESCDWQLPLREQMFFSIRLPELQQTRSYARLLTAKARLEIAEGRFEDALHTLQTGYALSRHVAQGQTLIHNLVGIAICNMMSKRLEDWAQQPGAPNLYWALTWLPRPLLDQRPAMETEMYCLYFSFPDLRDLDKAKHPPEQWNELLRKTVDRLFQMSDSVPSLPRPVLSTAMVLRGYPMARRALIEGGRPAAEVEAMPVAQVVLIYTMETYEELRDAMFKWYAVPYAQAREGAKRSQQTFEEATRLGNREILPFASVLLPAIESAHFASVKNERAIAMLRVIEALRLYGAAHEGRLPDDLAEITEVPIPSDPVTGKPFAYQHTSGTAVLEAPFVPGREAKVYGARYEIKFATKGK